MVNYSTTACVRSSTAGTGDQQSSCAGGLRLEHPPQRRGSLVRCCPPTRRPIGGHSERALCHRTSASGKSGQHIPRRNGRRWQKETIPQAKCAEETPHPSSGQTETTAACSSVQTAGAPTPDWICSTYRVTVSAYDLMPCQGEVEASEALCEPMRSTGFQVLFRTENQARHQARFDNKSGCLNFSSNRSTPFLFYPKHGAREIFYVQVKRGKNGQLIPREKACGCRCSWDSIPHSVPPAALAGRCRGFSSRAIPRAR